MRLKVLGPLVLIGMSLVGDVPLRAQSQPAFVIGVEFIAPKSGCPVFIRHVTAGGPADKAGLKSGDAVVSIDGVTIQTPDDMRKLSSDKPKPVRMEVMRADGKHAYDVPRVAYPE